MKNVLSLDFWSNLIDAGLGMPTTVEGIHATSGGSLEAFQSTSHKLDSNEIDAIKQTQSKGFRVIDIDPNAFTKEEAFCVYDDATLARIVGVAVSGYGFSAQVDSTAAPTVSGSPRPYWRTLQLEIPGNYLRVEFLPARVTPGRYSEVDPAENPVSILPQNTNLIGNTDQYTGVAAEAGRRTMLLDFETPSSTPLIVSDGDEFKTMFSTVLFTFKQLNVRIRLTIGYNSEITSRNTKETNLSLFGGFGLTKGSPIHPTPFCVSDRDVNATNYQGVTASNAPGYINLIYSPDYPGSLVGVPIGLGIFFITGFTVTTTNYVTSPTTQWYDVELVQAKVNVLTVPTYVIKRFCGVTVKNDGATSVVEFNEPIRVTLRPLECLALRTSFCYSPGNAAYDPQTGIKFQVTGYSFGNFSGEDISGIPKCPLQVNYFYKEHPFPQDLDTVDMPRR